MRIEIVKEAGKITIFIDSVNESIYPLLYILILHLGNGFSYIFLITRGVEFIRCLYLCRFNIAQRDKGRIN